MADSKTAEAIRGAIAVARRIGDDDVASRLLAILQLLSNSGEATASR